MMSKFFVTGGTGFIGSHLVEELLRNDDAKVRCLIRSERKWLDGLPIEEVRGDLFDDEVVAEAVRDVDVVFHNGGTTRAQDWDTFYRSNVESTVRLMEIIQRVNPDLRRIVVTSTLAVVGPCPDGAASESSPMNPISMYGRSKAEMERRLASFRERLPITVVRPPAVYGPREADIYTFFKTLEKRICPVVGDVREPVLSLVHVSDVVQGMLAAATAEDAVGGTYFLGSETFYSWNDVKEAATEAMGHGALTIAVPPMLVGAVGAITEAAAKLSGAYPPLNREKAREIRRACKMCRIDRARRDLDYNPSIPLKEGVRETIAWYRQEGWL